jgi:lipopolysaccharide export system ATP-binding protein
VEENLIVVMEICKIPKDQYSQLLDSIYTQFHLGNLRKSLGMSLSGGERRKVEIARSLILNPKFLLLDEPFAGIDPISIEEIQLLLKNLNLTQNIGILISDHNVRETLDICHKAYVLAEGRIICQGVPSHIIQDTNVQNLYLGSTFKI